MVLRPSSSSWSIAPETIMSHHYKLNRGVKSVIDTSPPFSMYNSPISVHYIPKRASSADAAKRRQPKLQRPHRELAEFVGSSYGRPPPALRLPLPLSDFNVKPKLLQSKNYQPPLHRKKPKPPLPPSPNNPWKEPSREQRKGSRKQKDAFCFDLFKDTVYSYVIDREVFTDGVITEAVDVAMEQWSDQISWDNLEYLREEIFDELGVRAKHFTAKSKNKPSVARKESKTKDRSSTSTGSGSSTPTSSGSSLSEMKTNSESKSASERSSQLDEDSDAASSSGGSQSSSVRSSSRSND